MSLLTLSFIVQLTATINRFVVYSVGCFSIVYRRGFKERRTGRTPPLKFSKIRVLGDIHDKCAHISVNYLPASHKRFYFYHSDSAR